MNTSLIFPQYRLAVMSKSPALGRVKTRMQPQLSKEESVQLHTTLTQYCIQQWRALGLCHIDLWVGGDVSLFQHKILSPLSEEIKQTVVWQQPEGDLGERMSVAVANTLNDGVDGVILVGTDCPFIDGEYIQSAIQHLNDGHDVVMGPANDGGYVLFGMKRHHASLFEGISWGTQTVFSSTMKKIQQQKLRCYVLPPLNDVDHYDDLAALAALSPQVSANGHVIHFSAYRGKAS
jgi:rSAM/selenodomain-associated transferase 1